MTPAGVGGGAGREIRTLISNILTYFDFSTWGMRKFTNIILEGLFVVGGEQHLRVAWTAPIQVLRDRDRRGARHADTDDTQRHRHRHRHLPSGETVNEESTKQAPPPPLL